MKYTISEEVIIKEQIDIYVCPFCGSGNLNVVHYAGSYGYSSDATYVKCKSCGAQGPVYTESVGTKNKQIKCAILDWNGANRE